MGTPWTPGPWEFKISKTDSKHPVDYVEIKRIPMRGEDWDALYLDVSGCASPATGRLIAEAPAMAEVLEDAIECGLVPISSAAEGGASKYSRQVVVADKIRAILARIKGETP